MTELHSKYLEFSIDCQNNQVHIGNDNSISMTEENNVVFYLAHDVYDYEEPEYYEDILKEE